MNAHILTHLLAPGYHAAGFPAAQAPFAFNAMIDRIAQQMDQRVFDLLQERVYQLVHSDDRALVGCLRQVAYHAFEGQ
jgi:hypothetical protein